MYLLAGDHHPAGSCAIIRAERVTGIAIEPNEEAFSDYPPVPNKHAAPIDSDGSLGSC